MVLNSLRKVLNLASLVLTLTTIVVLDIHSRMAGWKVAGNYSKVTDTQIQIEDDSVKVTYVHELSGLV